MNREYNMDKLSHIPGNNILYITGFSGSGKSTLARNKAYELKPAIIISLDTFANNTRSLFNTNRILSGGDKFIKNYFYEKYDGAFPFKNPDEPFGHYIQGYSNHVFLFIQHIRKEATYTETIFIIEGIQLIYLQVSIPTLFTGNEPLIIIDANIEEAAKRAVLRDMEYNYHGMSKEDYYQDRIKQNERIFDSLKILKRKFR